MNEKHISDLAVLVAEIIKRMGAAYGSPDDWRRDITTAVKIYEGISQDIQMRVRAPRKA
jgi:hypothetical protein